MVPDLQFVCQFWLYTVIFTYLCDIALSTKFIALGDSLFFKIVLEVY